MNQYPIRKAQEAEEGRNQCDDNLNMNSKNIYTHIL
jgi:hypothetical protein